MATGQTHRRACVPGWSCDGAFILYNKAGKACGFSGKKASRLFCAPLEVRRVVHCPPKCPQFMKRLFYGTPDHAIHAWGTQKFSESKLLIKCCWTLSVKEMFFTDGRFKFQKRHFQWTTYLLSAEVSLLLCIIQSSQTHTHIVALLIRCTVNWPKPTVRYKYGVICTDFDFPFLYV